MAKMGGLKRYMPITFWTYLAGMLALVGFPLTAGFFSKDEILSAAFSANKVVWAFGTFGAFLTAFYMTRQMCMVFGGEYRGGGARHGDDAHGRGQGPFPHEVPKNMWMPLVALAFFAVFLGWLGTPWLKHNLWHQYLSPDTHAHPANYWVMGVSVLAALAGLAAGYGIYGRRAVLGDGSDPLQPKLGGLWTLLRNKWYVDEIYDATLVRLNWICAALFRGVDASIDWTLQALAKMTWGVSQLWRWVGDEFLINGGVDVVSEGVRGAGGGFSKMQGGKVQNYLRIVGWGAAALVLVLLLLTYQHWKPLLGG
jgi:NADH-quinone oxidoreductase subunit L